MSNVKAASSAPDSPVTTGVELSFIRQQTEIQEKVQSSPKETKQEQPKDTAQISETTRWSSTDKTISPDELLKWVLETEKKDWESFLEWQPDPYINLSKQLQELSRLYLALLKAALKYAEGENLTKQMARLDSQLAEKLNLLIERNLDPLTSLLEETGQSNELDSIRFALFRLTAGKTLSLKAIHSLFDHTRAARGDQLGDYQTSSSFSGEGMIYQRSGKQNIQFQQTYHTQQHSWKEQLRQRQEIIENATKGIVEPSFKQGWGTSCSGKELARANRFATHIKNGGNLLKNPSVSARNEEVTGLLAAVMSMKGQVYAEKTGKTSSLALSLQNAIEKIMDQYLGRKGASKIYYHTLTAYKQTKNPQKAMEEGQDYAYKQFREKQKEPAYVKSSSYSKESGFFRPLLKGLSPEKEFVLGVNILKKDWQNFLNVIGDRETSSYLSRANVYSPWGILADTRSHRTGTTGEIGKLLLGAAVIVILSVLAVVCFQFL